MYKKEVYIEQGGMNPLAVVEKFCFVFIVSCSACNQASAYNFFGIYPDRVDGWWLQRTKRDS